MAFKNALRILINRFGLAWVLTLYVLALMVIIGSLSLLFIFPVVDALNAAGIFERAAETFTRLLDGASLGAFGQEVMDIVAEIAALFQGNGSLMVGTVVTFLVVLLINKFLLGFYELPLYRMLNGAMSADARLGFINQFVSTLGQSAQFVLVKILYTTAYDALFVLILYRLLGLFFVPYMVLFAPLIVSLYVIVFQALRYTLITFWGPEMVVGGGSVFRSFAFSVKKAGKHFASVFSSFVITWLLIVALTLFIGIFTLGAGLILTVPVCMLFILILNMTQYYNKTGRRYYADGEIITPPGVKDGAE